jgi:hypothetical protein
MTSIRFNPHFYARVDNIRNVLSQVESLDSTRLKEIFKELSAINQGIDEALLDPNSYDRESLQKLQHDVQLLVGSVQNRQINFDLYHLTDNAIELWLKRPASAEERKSRINELKIRMEDLTNNHRFTREDQRFIELFHTCVRGVEKGTLPSHLDKAETFSKSKKTKKENSAHIISIEEIKRKKIASLEEDPIGLAELLYPMAELVYKGDYSGFFDAYNNLPSQCQQALVQHVFVCNGNLISLARDSSRNKKHEVCIVQGIIGYANTIMGNSIQGSVYPSIISIHQMMLETSELDVH